MGLCGIEGFPSGNGFVFYTDVRQAFNPRLENIDIHFRIVNDTSFKIGLLVTP
jgi:hypothetical protein